MEVESLKGGEKGESRKKNKDNKLKMQKSWRVSCLIAFAIGPVDKTLGY